MTGIAATPEVSLDTRLQRVAGWRSQLAQPEFVL